MIIEGICYKEIDDHILSVIEHTNSGDYAIYRIENSELHKMLCSSSLPSMSDMTPEEYNSLTRDDAAAIVLESDRSLVSDTISKILEGKGTDNSSVFTLTL